MKDGDEDETQLELLPFDHKPIERPRPGHDGEAVYASMWEATMREARVDTWGDTEWPIEDILPGCFGKPTQRDASILATVACWLGTAIGTATVREAERQREAKTWAGDRCYLFAWTQENLRSGYKNGGIRTCEYLLALPEHRAAARTIMDSGLRELPELSARDLEAIDHLMLWLATGAGQRFLTRCEAKLEGIRQEQRILRAADRIRSEDGA
jgi:hypothetical protein